jgi:hypothetical protein
MDYLCFSIPLFEKLKINFRMGAVYIAISFVAVALMTTGCYRTLTGKKTLF